MPKSRLLSLPGNYLFFVAAVLFVAGSVASAYPGGRDRLAAPDMSRSRGVGFDQDFYYCSDYAGYAVCTFGTQGDNCNTCGPDANQNPYEDIGGEGYGIDPTSEGAVKCGVIWNGICAVTVTGGTAFCDTDGGMTNNPCPKPQGPPPFEPN